jgi:DNA-binding Lrp family transcriptional regulator
MPHAFDEIDRRILAHMQEEARISNVELAARVGLSAAPCLRRLRALEESGVIRKYVTLLDPAAVKLGVTVFVQISLDLQVEGRLEIFERALLRHPEVLECYLMTGDADYLVRVVVPDVAAYERFLKDVLTRIEGVAGIKSSFALKQVKYSTVLPLEPTKPVPVTPVPAPRRAKIRARRSFR